MYSVRIERASEGRRVNSSRDARDLACRESYNFILWFVLEEDVEVVECAEPSLGSVASCRPHDNRPNPTHEDEYFVMCLKLYPNT